VFSFSIFLSPELAARVEFLVIPRPGEASPPPPPGFQLRELQGFPLKVSSSTLRERIRRGASIQNLVPPAVEEAIRNYRLYLEG